MEFSSIHFCLFYFLVVRGIIFCLINGENAEDNNDNEAILYNEDSNLYADLVQKSILLIRKWNQEDSNEYSLTKIIEARMEKEIGPNSKVIMEKPYMCRLFGQLSRNTDLAMLAVLRHDVQFCKIHFHDLDNFLGALEHSGILLEEIFVVMSPCVHMELNGQAKLVRHFFFYKYVLQTTNILITNIGMNSKMQIKDMIYELVEPLTFWLLYGGKIGLIKNMEIRGGKMEIVELLMKNLIMLHHKKKMELTNNFVLTLNGFSLESIGLVEFKNGNALVLKRISDSIWELHYHNQSGMKDDEHRMKENEHNGMQKVDAIFEIDKFDF